MLALYRTGRQAEALAAYRDARAALVEELGIEPSTELRALHEAILAQDGSLLATAPEPPRDTAETGATGAPAGTNGSAGRNAAAGAGASTGESAPAPREERKVVTILCAGLAAFADWATLSDPEDLRTLLAPYHRSVRAELERFGGTVEKFTGGEVIALFGAPIAHEDDPERAVRAGLAILDAIAELNEADPDLDLQVRVGVNTGEAVVALTAHPEQGEGLVTGDVINAATRLQSAAPVNGVAVGEQAYRATSRVFEYEELSPVVMKGATGRLSLWHAKAARFRFGGDVRRQFKTPCVGRELEKSLLIAAFERAVQQRSLQLVTIVTSLARTRSLKAAVRPDTPPGAARGVISSKSSGLARWSARGRLRVNDRARSPAPALLLRQRSSHSGGADNPAYDDCLRTGGATRS
jgi:class 3 adenylate cyclase